MVVTPPLPGPDSPFKIDKKIEPADSYVQRLQKIIPIEITALYFFLSKLVSDSPQFALFFALCIFFVIIFSYFFYLPRQQNVLSRSQRVIILTSFIVWSVNIDVELTKIILFDLAGLFSITQGSIYHFIQNINAIPLAMILAVWTFAVPVFYKS